MIYVETRSHRLSLIEIASAQIQMAIVCFNDAVCTVALVRIAQVNAVVGMEWDRTNSTVHVNIFQIEAIAPISSRSIELDQHG